MAENLERLTMKDEKTTRDQSHERDTDISNLPRRHGEERADHADRVPIYLPDEIILHILAYIRQPAQPTLATCCLLSRQWHAAALPFLYAHPRLYGHNFDPFVSSVCPSKNLSVRTNPLASLVRTLDMSGLVHQADKSTTARLLGRTKAGLEVFVAPVRGFAFHAFPALAKSLKLRVLDLSLVSESPPLPVLFKSIAHLTNLQTFRLPRSAGFGIHHSASSFPWPPNLTALSLSGGIDAHFLHGVVAFPSTLRSLTIEHCPSAKGFAVTHLLRKAVAPLQSLRRLRIAHMPRLSGHALDGVLFLLPQLEELSVSVDYITPAIFDEAHLSHIKEPLIVPSGGATPSLEPPDTIDLADPSTSSAPPEPPTTPSLRTLELTYSGTPADITDKISPLDIMIAIDDGVLPRLRQVRVATSLMWQEAEAESLSDVLVELARDDGLSDGRGKMRGEVEVGVWRFEG